MDDCIISPIGIVSCPRKYRYETPRQAVLATDVSAVIRLEPHRNFEQALRDLEGFERIWVLYIFHLNRGWKPLVRVPRHRADKVGVFATRAPYRPNPVGLSCVRLERIEGLDLHVSEVDILDGSPVIDLKPYLPYADAFPAARCGWVPDAVAARYAISYDALAERQCAWLLQHGGINLPGFIAVQLQHDPLDASRKRVTPGDGQRPHLLAYRTWRVAYAVSEEPAELRVLGISSGYSAEELADAADPHGDKELHRRFTAGLDPE